MKKLNWIIKPFAVIGMNSIPIYERKQPESDDSAGLSEFLQEDFCKWQVLPDIYISAFTSA